MLVSEADNRHRSGVGLLMGQNRYRVERLKSHLLLGALGDQLR